ncbi:MAG: peptidase dimerization domain-containing protein [Enterocloster clostridioformis]
MAEAGLPYPPQGHWARKASRFAKIWGMSTVTFGQITGGYRPYVVPDSCKVWIDMRLVPPTDTAAAKIYSRGEL